jgi:hypothetical protein
MDKDFEAKVRHMMARRKLLTIDEVETISTKAILDENVELMRVVQWGIWYKVRADLLEGGILGALNLADSMTSLKGEE